MLTIPPRMRIAVISRNFARTAGGAESYAVSVAEALARRHQVHVFAQDCPVEVPGVVFHRVWRLSLRPRWLNQLLFALATWWATRRGFDAVHSHENTWHGQIQTVHVRPLRYNQLQARARRSALKRLLHGLQLFTSPRLLTYVALEAARFAPRPGRSVVATSETLLHECVAAYPRARASLQVITPGTTLPSAQTPPPQARAALGLPAGGTWLLFVANDYRRKGLDALLRALARLPVTFSLMVAGQPGAAPRYVEQLARLGLQDRVHFLGSRRDLAPVYDAADLLVHPTLEDTFAMVVLEAMAHGLPVVVSGPAHCGISRHLTHGRQVLLLDDPQDDATLAEQVRSIADDASLAAALSQAARAYAATHSWEHAALQYEALCQRAARGTDPGPARTSTP